ncbi:insulin receptor, isoform CRA_a, partial [Mus musculus]
APGSVRVHVSEKDQGRQLMLTSGFHVHEHLCVPAYKCTHRHKCPHTYTHRQMKGR